ncbi:MAG: cysteine desulfurase [Candidatus Pacebacteria bacterium]|nr:cysteine desulfurase [Candidatus Paceibacterota bacterium]
MPKQIYLDYAATTPIDEEVLEAMMPYLKKDFGNPSSLHHFGQITRVAIDQTRKKAARFLNCSESEIVFCGSATEANSLAIFGVVKALQKKIKKPFHIITTKIEHHAVLHPFEELEKQGVEVSFVAPNKIGIVETKEIKKAIKDNTVFISVMYANNEIGTVQPIEEIGKLISQINKNRKQKIYFHTDAVQAVNYLDCDVQKLKVDLLTLSAHKIYGPKGVGALFIKKGTPIEPIIYGGGHEFGLRSGTENVAGIVGLGKAIELVEKHKGDTERIKNLRDKIIEEVLKIPNAKLNGSRENRLPNNVNVSISGVEGESLVIALDQEGIAVSTGSACSSHELKPSHVLLAIGLSPKSTHGSLRITLGRFTTEDEIDYFLKVLPKVVKRLREISPF